MKHVFEDAPVSECVNRSLELERRGRKASRRMNLRKNVCTCTTNVRVHTRAPQAQEQSTADILKRVNAKASMHIAVCVQIDRCRMSINTVHTVRTGRSTRYGVMQPRTAEDRDQKQSSQSGPTERTS